MPNLGPPRPASLRRILYWRLPIKSNKYVNICTVSSAQAASIIYYYNSIIWNITLIAEYWTDFVKIWLYWRHEENAKYVKRFCKIFWTGDIGVKCWFYICKCKCFIEEMDLLSNIWALDERSQLINKVNLLTITFTSSLIKESHFGKIEKLF